MQPFSEKYRPSSTTEVIGNEQAVQRALTFAKQFPQKKKGLLLHGPPGVGKTSLVCAIASELNLELVEFNASDVRNAKIIEQLLGASLKQRSLFAKGKLILFDEVDGVSGRKDRGGVSTLIKFLKESTYPIILTANNPWASKFSSLRRSVELVGLEPLTHTEVMQVLIDICNKEQLSYDDQAMKTIARRSGGDLRGALTDLQTLQPYGKITSDVVGILDDRRKADTLQNALMRVFKTTDPSISRQSFDDIDEDFDEFMLWIEENIPREYSKPEDLQRAMDALSRADVFKGRIRRWQHWRFLVYMKDWLTAGISLAKTEKYPGMMKYERTTRILKIWKANMANKKRDAIAEKFAQMTHTSKKQAIRNIPYVRYMIKHDPRHALIEDLELDADEVAWLQK